MSVFGSSNYAQDEALLLQRFRQLDNDQRDEVIKTLPKAPPTDAEEYSIQIDYINKIASLHPDSRVLRTEDDVSKWEQELGEDAGITNILEDIIQKSKSGPSQSDGLITVTPKTIVQNGAPLNVPYAVFEYDATEFQQGRPTRMLHFKHNGETVVTFKKVIGPWMVSFPKSLDTDYFTVDKKICVYIADDI
jgi:hypothetical protein